MPEGPSIYILKELVQDFKGKKVEEASGNLKTFDTAILEGRTLTDFRSWGKHFLILFGDDITVRIHFLMFGSYRINEVKDAPPRLHLGFGDGTELNFYTCAVRLLEAPPDEIYDFTGDVMNEGWNARAALKKLRAAPGTMACDALLDQNIFAGVGNIIKNEVLFRIRVHPESLIGALPPKKLRELVQEAVTYSFDFLHWKKEFTLRQHWLAHNKKTCPRDGTPYVKGHLGKTDRRTFYCPVCQKRYG